MIAEASEKTITDSEFDALRITISANPKGRAFLEEYVRRGQPDETRRLLGAVRRFENSIPSLRQGADRNIIAREAAALRAIADDMCTIIDRMSSDDEALADEFCTLIANLHTCLNAITAVLDEEAVPRPPSGSSLDAEIETGDSETGNSELPSPPDISVSEA